MQMIYVQTPPVHHAKYVLKIQVSITRSIGENVHSLSILGTLGSLEILLVDEMIDRLLDIWHLWRELGRDRRCHLLDKSLVLHGLERILC